MFDEVFNPVQAAAHLKISTFTLARHVRAGRYREHRIGRLKRYFRSELDEDTKRPAPEKEVRRHCDRKRDALEAFLFD